MNGLWASLAPLAAGSALVPIQIVMTLLLLRSSYGRRTAVAWVAGLTTTRLLQGLVFGLLISSTGKSASSDDGSKLIVSVLMLVMAVLFYVTAFRQLAADEDPDAPPPKWLHMAESITPLKAFVFSAAYLAVAAKFWVFTLSAISAIGAANLSKAEGIGTYLLFVLLSESVILMVVGAALVAPKRSASVLTYMNDWLAEHNRILVIVLGTVFGTWFLIKALTGLGII